MFRKGKKEREATSLPLPPSSFSLIVIVSGWTFTNTNDAVGGRLSMLHCYSSASFTSVSVMLKLHERCLAYSSNFPLVLVMEKKNNVAYPSIILPASLCCSLRRHQCFSSKYFSCIIISSSSNVSLTSNTFHCGSTPTSYCSYYLFLISMQLHPISYLTTLYMFRTVHLFPLLLSVFLFTTHISIISLSISPPRPPPCPFSSRISPLCTFILSLPSLHNNNESYYSLCVRAAIFFFFFFLPRLIFPNCARSEAS